MSDEAAFGFAGVFVVCFAAAGLRVACFGAGFFVVVVLMVCLLWLDSTSLAEPGPMSTD